MVILTYWITVVLEFFFGITFWLSAVTQRYESNFDKVMAFLVSTTMLVGAMMLLGAKRWYL